jgi:GTPase SAR1 family protein
MLEPKYKSKLFFIKVILIGDVRVGKTSFLYSATGRSQNTIQPTMGIDFLSTSVPLHGKNIKVEIWDTSTFLQ